MHNRNSKLFACISFGLVLLTSYMLLMDRLGAALLFLSFAWLFGAIAEALHKKEQ